MRTGLVTTMVLLLVSSTAWAEDEAPTAAPPKAAPAAPKRITREDGTVLHFYRPNFVTPTSLAKNLSALGLPEEVNLHLLDRQGTLVLAGPPADVDRALGVVAHLDVAQPQVWVEAKVMLVTRSEAKGSVLRPAEEGEAPSKRPNVVVLGDGTTANQVLTALKTTGSVELVARASVLVTQGYKAHVSQIESHPTLITFEARTADTVRRTSSMETTLRLTVTAQHVGERFVTLEVAPEFRGLREAERLARSTVAPTQMSHAATTTVTIETGKSVVIGGLVTEREAERKADPTIVVTRSPGDLGGASADKSARETEVVIVITPKIVSVTANK